MRAYALLGGPKEEFPSDLKEKFLNAKNNQALIIGVDRGTKTLLDLGIKPDVGIGDFDSLKSNELDLIEANIPDIRYSNPIKDLTDSELMIQVAFNDYQIDDLIIYGSTGGRIDHFLVNLFMVLNPKIRPYAEKIRLIDKQNKIIFLNPGKHILKQDSNYKYFAVGSLSAIEKLNIKDARYDLTDYSSDSPKVFASNEFKQDQKEVKIHFLAGLVVIIYSKDLDRYYRMKKSR